MGMTCPLCTTLTDSRGNCLRHVITTTYFGETQQNFITLRKKKDATVPNLIIDALQSELLKSVLEYTRNRTRLACSSMYRLDA